MAYSYPRKRFLKKWLTLPEFQQWLQQCRDDPEKAYCKICQKDLSAEMSSLRRHGSTQIHLARMKAAQQDEGEPSSYHPMNDVGHGARTEMVLFAAWLASNNLPFSVADSFIPLGKCMFPESEIAQRMSTKGIKATEVVESLCKAVTQDTVKKLQTNYFSIIIDGTTDLSIHKPCCIVVRFFDDATTNITTRALTLLDTCPSTNITGISTGESICNSIISTLKYYRIPLDNWVGCAADGASDIMSIHNSSKIRDNLPGLQIFKCVYESIHLCTSEAARTLPKTCEVLLREIYNYFCCSAKRLNELSKFQELCDLKPHRLVQPRRQTLLLSQHQAVAQLLEQWAPVRAYFNELKSQDHKLLNIDNIISMLEDPCNRIYLLFLEFILDKANKFNAFFLKGKGTVNMLHYKSSELYFEVLGYFCRSHVLVSNRDTLENLDPKDESMYLPLNQIYLGDKLHVEFNTTNRYDPRIIADIRTRCRVFLITFCVQMRKRFDFENKLLKYAHYLSPRLVLSITTREVMPTLVDFFSMVPRFKKIKMGVVGEEWRRLNFYNFPEEMKDATMEIEEFYKKMSKIEDDFGNLLFAEFSKFALNILALPCLNVDTERIFSKLSLVKNKTRNRLSFSTINAIVALHEEVELQGVIA